MRLLRRLLILTVIAGVAQAWGAGAREAYIGYVYPAGGRQGASFEVRVGGQNIRGVRDIYVSGEGVHATVMRYEGAEGPLNRKQREELRRRLQEIRDQRVRAWTGKAAAPVPKAGGSTQPPRVTLPDLSDLRDLEMRSVRELRKIAERYLNPDKRPKAPVAETAFLQVTIDPGAVTGDREIRLRATAGVTNPMLFQVGQPPETLAQDPDDASEVPTVAVSLPATLNGRIMPGAVDHFRVKARAGQHLVIQVEARGLVPYLADAVPGWFQAVVALRDATGKEVAYVDDYRFDPDPVLFYEVPKDGEYTIEIRDSIYRGREDFVYRILAGEQPFITRLFPLGGRAGTPTTAAVAGWNLPWQQVQLDTKPEGDWIRYASWRAGDGLTNRVAYAVDTLPEINETEPNDAGKDAQKITAPVVINGRISRPGDVDTFRFEGQAGDEVVAEVYARRLGSPLDSLLRLIDGTGKVLAWNDDRPDKEMGLLTHSADSYISFKLPAKGSYVVQLSDAQRHGGEEYAYRLRLGPRHPDFALRISPSSISVFGGRPTVIDAFAIRKDGFDGNIELALKDAPEGFFLSGGWIPAGRDHVRLTLTAPIQQMEIPVALHLEGRAQVGGAMVVRPVVPADDMMQAFLYRHVVPARELMVSVLGKGRKAPGATVTGGPVKVPAGGSARVQVAVPALPATIKAVVLKLIEPPEGLTIEDPQTEPGAISFTLKAKADAPKVGYADNAIIEVFSGESSLGPLPAVAFQIVKPEPAKP
jgi:hypothetical protein